MRLRSTVTAGISFVAVILGLACLPLLSRSGNEAGAGWPSGTGTVTEIAAMHIARASHSSTLLPNGKVLIAGGFAGSGGEYRPYASAELFDPGTGTFQAVTNMSVGRSAHTASLLKNGKVLIVGGWTGMNDLRGSAEIYDPATGKFTLTGSMIEPRGSHTATALKDGRVLIVGGGSGHYPSQTIYRPAEIFDPATGRFTLTGERSVGRHKHAAILLRSGKVLVVGGSDNRDWHGEYASAELYDPASGTFSATGPMSTPRFKLPEAVTLLPNGRVLVAGGGAFAELYDETTGTFTRVPGSLGAARFFASATLLPGGKALISGGYAESDSGLPATPAAWLYQP